MFTEVIIDMAKALVFPIMYKTLVYFYSPAIEVSELEKVKEHIIIELFQVLISGHVSTDLQRLMRFTTQKEEIMLAERQYANRLKTLEDIGVEKNFCLNHHL